MDFDCFYLLYWQFSEYYQWLIDVLVVVVFDVVEDLLCFDDLLVCVFFVLCEVLGRLVGLLGWCNDLVGCLCFGLYEFICLECCVDQVIVYGLVGCFWCVDFVLECIVDGEYFCCYDQFGVVKFVLCFCCMFSVSGILLYMEIWVFCFDCVSCLCFIFYWLVICLVSGLICWCLLVGIEWCLG